MRVQGYDIASHPLGQPRDDIKIGLDGWTVTTTLLCFYATWFAQVSTVILRQNALYPTCLLTAIWVKQEEEMGELCLVVLTFDQRYSNTPSTPTPPPQFGVNAGRVMQDITLHPNFSAGGYAWDANAPWSQFWDAALKDWKSSVNSDGTRSYLESVPAYLIGWTKFPDTACTVWTKIYYRALPADPLPGNVIRDPGFGFGPSGCYLVSSCDQQKENAFWCRTTHFDYYPNGVPTEIFQRG